MGASGEGGSDPRKAKRRSYVRCSIQVPIEDDWIRRPPPVAPRVIATQRKRLVTSFFLGGIACSADRALLQTVQFLVGGGD